MYCAPQPNIPNEKKTSVAGRDYIVKFVKGETNPDFVGLVKFLNQRPDS
jgi:hypothetical protein